MCSVGARPGPGLKNTAQRGFQKILDEDHLELNPSLKVVVFCFVSKFKEKFIMS